MRVAILMPAYEEGPRLALQLAAVAREAEGVGGIVVYVVDDGSSKAVKLEALPAANENFDIVLLRHAVNLGQGAALETARRIALRDPNHDVFVTMDSDGQHRPSYLPQFVAKVREGNDVVFGDRFGAVTHMPFHRRTLLRLARIFEGVVTGLWLSDAHNGFRAFGRKGLEVVRLRQNRMAHATEIKQSVAAHKHTLKIAELPVSIVYTDETLAKGQSSLGAVQILRDLTFRFFFGPE